jgi:hypothetical protein
MNKDDPERAWMCHECATLFIFRSDKEMHKKLFGHDHFATFDIESGNQIHRAAA